MSVVDWHLTPESSNVLGYGFEDTTKEIVVAFKNGSVYCYDPAASVYAAMVQSESKGKFVNRALKESGVAVRRVKIHSWVGENLTEVDNGE